MRSAMFSVMGLLAALAAPAWGVQTVTAEQAATRSATVAQRNASLAQLERATPRTGNLSGGATTVGAPRVNATEAATPSPPFSNDYRAYPPSCLADPLPFNSSGPTYSKLVRLAAFNPNTSQYSAEDVTITLWRIPCTSAGQFANSVTLMAIDRANNLDGTSPYVLFPGMAVTQGNSTLKLVRVATEPNTVRAHVTVDTPVIFNSDSTYVLENFASDSTATAYWDFNAAFTVTFYNYFQGDTGQALSVPSYSPTTATYPDAYKTIPINGYLSGNWFDQTASARGNEGMTVQIFELPAPSTDYLFTFSLFTYDANGFPYWLFGSKAFPANSRGPIVVDTIYSQSGSFLNGQASNSSSQTWGTVTVSFDDCARMHFVARKTAVSSIAPGTTNVDIVRDWTRFLGTSVLNLNALTCE